RLGGRYRIEVGGTQLERDEEGHVAVRLRDVVVRDPDRVVVATAPKAEVGVSGSALMTGRIEVRRLSLIGAGMSVRIEPDGQVTVFASAEQRPIATAPAVAAIGSSAAARPPAPASQSPAAAPAAFAALLGWLARLDALGLDGRDLAEVGLKSGSLSVDDLRGRKRWTFENINLSLTRPREGGVAFAVNSTGTDGPWSLITTVTPRDGTGRRSIEAVIRDLSPKDLLLALRLDDGGISGGRPISAVWRAEIAPDGPVPSVHGRAVIGAGHVGEADDPDGRFLIDEAQLNLRWDAESRRLVVPFEVLSAGNRVSLLAHIEAPSEPDGAWGIAIGRGQIVLSSAERSREPPLILDRVALRGRIDPVKRRFELEQGDLSGMAASVAFRGVLDYSGPEPRLSAGLFGTRMSVAALKRLWPAMV